MDFTILLPFVAFASCAAITKGTGMLIYMFIFFLSNKHAYIFDLHRKY